MKEYVEGGDLESLLKSTGGLHFEVACKFLSEVVVTLDYIHSLGSIHRNIKPDK